MEDSEQRPGNSAPAGDETSRSCMGAMRHYVHGQISALRQDLKDRSEGKAGRGLFEDVNNLKASKTQALAKEQEVKFGDTFFGRLASHRYFEGITMTVILLNAVAIGVDADYNARFNRPESLYDGPVYFIVQDLFFAVYFSAELIIRFLGYRRKRKCFSDGWFVFDSFLVLLMDVETFILPFVGSSGMPNLSILRMLRLLRISRMAKLMRTFPELMLIVKGLGAAVRAVTWTFVLIMMVLFVCAIIFTSVYHQGLKSDEEIANKIESLFGDMSKSMFSLIIMGTLLDDVTFCADHIRASGNFYMLAAFVVFIILSSFMMLNMLLGILVEVVANTAEGEKAKEKNITVRKEMLKIVSDLAGDEPGIRRDQFLFLAFDKSVLKHLTELGIKESHFQHFSCILYGDVAADDNDESKLISAEEIVAMLFRLQPSQPLEGGDLATAEKAILEQRKMLRKRLSTLEGLVSMAGGDIAPSPSPSRPTSVIMANSPPVPPVQELDTLVLEGPPALERKPSEKKIFRKANSKESVTTSGGDNWSSWDGRGKITMELLGMLNRTDTSTLVDEIRRRHGFDDLETTGVPLEWFDDEMKTEMDSPNPAVSSEYS